MGMEAVPIRAGSTPRAEQATRRGLLYNPFSLWIGFLAVHLIISGLALDQGKGLGDVFLVYKPWAQLAAQGTQIMGVNSDWVYPFGAIVPIMLPLLFGARLRLGVAEHGAAAERRGLRGADRGS